jgi:predicted phage tail protein
MSRLQSLYGVTIDDPNLEILMRHRAVLFGILGAFLIYAAFRPGLQLAALIAGAVSVISFLVIAGMVGSYNTGIARVVTADIVAIVCLLIGAFAYWKDRVTIGVH